MWDTFAYQSVREVPFVPTAYLAVLIQIEGPGRAENFQIIESVRAFRFTNLKLIGFADSYHSW